MELGFYSLCQTFEEMMELAAAGTDRTVSQYTSDVNYASNAVNDDHSAYVAMATQLQDTPVQLFAFGKAAGSKLGRSLLLYLRQGGYVIVLVCLSACLSVCLLATLRKNFRTDLHEIFGKVGNGLVNN